MNSKHRDGATGAGRGPLYGPVEEKNTEILRLIARLKECLDKDNFRNDPEYGICLAKLIQSMKALLLAEETWLYDASEPGTAGERRAMQGMIRKLERALSCLDMPQGIHHRRIADFISGAFQAHLHALQNSSAAEDPMLFYLPALRVNHALMQKEGSREPGR